MRLTENATLRENTMAFPENAALTNLEEASIPLEHV